MWWALLATTIFVALLLLVWAAIAGVHEEDGVTTARNPDSWAARIGIVCTTLAFVAVLFYRYYKDR